jgi:hypothetical protein
MHHNTPAAFLRQVLKAVFGVHVLLGEVAVLVLEARVIDGEQFAEDLTFHLFDKVGEGVAIDEAALLGVVGVQVEVERQSAVCN